MTRPIAPTGLIRSLFVLLITAPVAADDTIVGSPHDLSMMSPNSIKAVSEDRVCIFCHVPHNAQPQAPAWNRFDPQTYYRVYQSSTTDARIGQPSGPSKMCLSCHDGLMALGMVGSGANLPGDPPPDHPIVMTRYFMPPGPSNLTNDLSDDHPIGFRYDRALYRRDPEIRPPDAISREIPLGKHGEVHCTACHDPHNNRLGNFLRITDRRSALCLTCHDQFGWRESSHANVPAHTVGRRVDPNGPLPYSSMPDNGCAICHKVHSAPRPQQLLRFPGNDTNCLNCHDGTVARTNILSEINKLSGHRTGLLNREHDPAERDLTMPPHAVCADCHDPHASRPDPPVRVRGSIPVLSDGATRGARGITIAGAPTKKATFVYEICFRCHADNASRIRSTVVRWVQESNTRREFQPFNPSFHPVTSPRANPDVVSLIPLWNTGTVMSCTDCHSSENAKSVGGGGPNGPHGSRYQPLLNQRYETRDLSVESAQSYALCYQCHDRTSILRDDSFSLHRLHIVVARTPCAVCHDPHGIPAGSGPSDGHTNLINFDRFVVRPVQTAGGLLPVRYQDTGKYTGNCTLQCHGVTHINLGYGPGAAPPPKLKLLGRLGK